MLEGRQISAPKGQVDEMGSFLDNMFSAVDPKQGKLGEFLNNRKIDRK